MRIFYPLLLFILCAQTVRAQVQPYLPEIFGEYNTVRDLAIGEDEVYFTIQSFGNELSAIVYIDLSKRKKAVQITSFSGKYKDLEPFLAPDGLSLYFASNRPINDLLKDKTDFNLWYVKRETKESEWSEPIALPSSINGPHNEFYPAVASSGNIYFTSDRPQHLGKDDLFVSEWNGYAYEEAKNLGSTINSEGYEFNAFVSPKEDLIIYTAYNREDGYGSGDLYISRKEKNGDWGAAENLGGEINSDKMDYCPFYDKKSGMLYFTSRRSSVDPQIKQRTLNEFIKEIDQYENGLSRIYKIAYLID